MQLVPGHAGLLMQAGNAFGDTRYGAHLGCAAELQTEPGIQALLAVAWRETMLCGDHRHAKAQGRQPAQDEPLETMPIDQQRTFSRLKKPPQAASVRAAVQLHAGVKESVGKTLRAIQQEHLMVAGRVLAMIKQHSFQSVEAAAAE